MNEKHTLMLEITNCEDCLLKKSYKGHGECFEYCSHPDSPEGYQSIICGCQEKFTETPSWCPILKKETDQDLIEFIKQEYFLVRSYSNKIRSR